MVNTQLVWFNIHTLHIDKGSIAELQSTTLQMTLWIDSLLTRMRRSVNAACGNPITELKTRAPKGCKRRTGAKRDAKKCQKPVREKRARKIKVFGIIALVVALGASPPPPTHPHPPPFNTLPTRRPHPPKCRTSIHHTGFNKYLFVFSFRINMIAVAELSYRWSIDKMARRQRCRFLFLPALWG